MLDCLVKNLIFITMACFLPQMQNGTCILPRIGFFVSRLSPRETKVGCKPLISSRVQCDQNVNRLKYVKSAKASTDVPASVHFPSTLNELPLRSFVTGPRIHLAASSVVERFLVCFDPFHCIFLEDMDFRSELLPQDLASGEFPFTVVY